MKEKLISPETYQNTLNLINMKTLKLQRVTRYFGYILLATVLFSSCGLRARQG